MKKFIFAALIVPFTVAAQPSSQVAWTAEQLNFVKSGELQKGKELAQTCNACHGDSGISSIPGIPSLAGQLSTYLYKQLQDYSTENRQHGIMSALAKSLSKQDAADLAVWFATLTPPSQPAKPAVYENAEKLVKNGSNDRILPPCEVCHGSHGQGAKIDLPALSGQNAEYLSVTLKAFKDGSRHNDIYSRMRIIAEALTEQEISELGLYYQNIRQ
jgi:cytochrome c553